ncbi:hypothetical protein HU200_046603 [Digitaria exilis]|uniref:DM2 domain-containing protein n=1 Tax=Digitaria exilis TaxID=1010633 RepID=A0A835ECC0_9POAL|nr:hypothetical protein HU200_046603 [Digitaria exilis]
MAALARVFRGSRFLMSPAVGSVGAKRTAAAAAAAAQVTKGEATAAKEKRGIMKPLPVSEELSRFAGGKPEVARSEAVKLIWDHIKANSLQVAPCSEKFLSMNWQNPAKKSEINCDATLKSLFGGRDKVGMLEISRLLNPHFLKN